MRLLALLTALSLLSPYAEAARCKKNKIVKIAVVDSGFGWNERGHGAKLCKYGHKDFSSDHQLTGSFDTKDPVPLDTMGHGTNIVGIIDDQLKKTNLNYCIVVIKYYSVNQSGEMNLNASIKAFQYAVNLNVDYINYSGGGDNFSVEESNVVKKYLDKGGRLIAAAGNDGRDLTLGSYYPAMYDKRIIVVGNRTADGVRSVLSNYGSPVNRWEVGENVKAYGITLTGTSQATAAATGKIVSESKCDTRN